MHLLNKIVLASILSVGLSHAGTVPCNGFKIEFKNGSQQDLVVDAVNFEGANVSSFDPMTLEVNKHLLFTVNDAQESHDIRGEFLFHSVAYPYKKLKLDINLTNKDLICEVGDSAKQGDLNIDFHRLLGGLYLSIKE